MTVTQTIYKNNDTVVGGMAKIADRITEGQPDGKKQSTEAMAAPCLKTEFTNRASAFTHLKTKYKHIVFLFL